MEVSKSWESEGRIAWAVTIVFFMFTMTVTSSADVNCTRCETDCQIAFAYDSENSLRNLCLLEFMGLKRWGFEMLNFNVDDFYNGSESQTLTLDIYTGAKECNLAVGMIVGEIELTFDKNYNELSIKYIIDEPFIMTEVSSYAGFDILAFDRYGYHTADPTHFQKLYKDKNGFKTHTFKHIVNHPELNFNIIAYASVFDTTLIKNSPTEAVEPVMLDTNSVRDPMIKHLS